MDLDRTTATSDIPTDGANCANPKFLTGLGLGLGSQFIYLVGYEFPTKGSSLPGILVALFNPREFLPSLL